MKSLLLQFAETLDRTLKKGRGSSGIMNLTVSQLQYLETIASLERATVTAIAEELQVTKPSATAAVSRLIELGYISSTPSMRDGRVHFLELTEAGKQLAFLKRTDNPGLSGVYGKRAHTPRISGISDFAAKIS